MNIIKQEVKAKSRKLMAKWTVTYETMEPEIKEVIEGELAKTLQEEIDWEIMCDMMVTLGYTKVEMKWSEMMNEVEAHMIKEWCRENLQGHYQGRGKIWMFEKEKDASMFILRWS